MRDERIHALAALARTLFSADAAVIRLAEMTGYSLFASGLPEAARAYQVLDRASGDAAVIEPDAVAVQIRLSGGKAVGSVAVFLSKRAAEPDSSRLQALRTVADQVSLLLEPHDGGILDAIVDNLPVALFCKDISRDYSFNLWNKQAERMFGLEKSSMLGKSDFDVFPQEQAEHFRRKDLETVRGGRAIEVAEEPVDSPVYGRRYLHTIKTAIRDKQGVSRYLLGITEDITARRRDECVIAEQQMQIIRSAKLSSLGEMAGGIAHEINNPLAIIHGKASQLKGLVERGEVDPARVAACAEKIESTAWRISKIIKGLRSFARDGDQDPDENVRLATVVDDTLELCRERFRHQGIELRIAAIPDVPLRCRPTQISQVLLNLLNNAYDAVLDKAERWVEIHVEASPLFVQIAVTDSGRGISQEIAEKIMQPFFTTKEVGKGTGLGLSISKGIVEDHGGTLRLDPGHPHTRFWVQLPIARAAGSEGNAA